MAFAVGFLSFFLFTFLAIVGIMIYNGMGHQVDYADELQVHLLPSRLCRSGHQSHLFWHALAAPQVFERLGNLLSWP